MLDDFPSELSAAGAKQGGPPWSSRPMTGLGTASSNSCVAVEKVANIRCIAIYAMMMRQAANYGQESTCYGPHIATQNLAPWIHNTNSAQYQLIQLCHVACVAYVALRASHMSRM